MSTKEATIPSGVEDKLKALGYELPQSAPAMALYAPVSLHNNIAYVSGQLPRVGDRVVAIGAVGAEVSVEDARVAARICVLRGLAALKHALGSLDGIERMLKLTVFVHSAPTFHGHSDVADGASELIDRLFPGSHARSAVGVAQLPKNAAVEIELSAVLR